MSRLLWRTPSEREATISKRKVENRDQDEARERSGQRTPAQTPDEEIPFQLKGHIVKLGIVELGKVQDISPCVTDVASIR